MRGWSASRSSAKGSDASQWSGKGRTRASGAGKDGTRASGAGVGRKRAPGRPAARRIASRGTLAPRTESRTTASRPTAPRTARAATQLRPTSHAQRHRGGQRQYARRPRRAHVPPPPHPKSVVQSENGAAPSDITEGAALFICSAVCALSCPCDINWLRDPLDSHQPRNFD